MAGCAEKTSIGSGDRAAQEKSLNGGPMPPDVAAKIAEARKNGGQAATAAGIKAAQSATTGSPK